MARWIRDLIHTKKGSKGQPATSTWTPFLSDLQEVSPIAHSHEDQRPEPRSGHRLWANEHFLYLVGGYNPERTQVTSFSPQHQLPQHLLHSPDRHPMLKEVWRLNLLTGRWKLIKTTGEFPKEMASFALISDHEGSKIYVLGGTDIPFGNTATNSVKEFSLSTKQWRSVECTGVPPVPSYGQAVLRDKENPHTIYSIGGTTGFNYIMTVHKLTISPEAPKSIKISGVKKEGEVSRSRSKSPPGGRWEMLHPGIDIQARYRHEAVWHNGKILLFGGGQQSGNVLFGFKELDVFCPERRLWEKLFTSGDPLAPTDLQAFPQPRRCHGLCHHGDRVWITGGCGVKTNALGVPEPATEIELLDDVWYLDLSTMRWHKHHSALKEKTYFHDSAITPDGCLLNFGGVLDHRGEKRSARTTQVWTVPPSLQRLAMDQLLRKTRIEELTTVHEAQIMGIPKRFAVWMHWEKCEEKIK